MTYEFKFGDPCWVELFTRDTDRAIDFYGQLFGWTAEANPDFGGYITFFKDGKSVAGGMRAPDENAGPQQWLVYLAGNADTVVERARSRGGQVVVDPMDVGDLGRMAVLGDAAGAGVGVWQAAVHKGFEAIGIASGGTWTDHAGRPSWFELHTPEYRKELEFYTEVFDWAPFTVADTPEFRYTTIHGTTPMLGGVMDNSADLPAGSTGSWTVYFGADDVDAAVKSVVALGGSVESEPQNTPYGRLAAVVDPNGVRFSIAGNNS
ncbi:VOC family protein [Nocardia stercoris]|uniref:VOC family protein n=1 Tax=Nocardia stercoris TaxID=2483361 RepID=A0A3M2L5U2_9NOCA|nr:VOC family protein [Nocardia stercoris]RMI33019.1 VOC family protein [Nocardia stercoris]